MRILHILLPLLIAGVACTSSDDGATTDGGSDTDTSADTDTDTDTGEPATIDCAVDAWDLNADAGWKSAWMAACMVPEIAPIMQEIDATLYENFSCGHCHGEDPASVDFTMPAGPVLDFSMSDSWDPKYIDPMTFSGPMADVTDRAVELLGYEPYDPNTMTGFGCGGCHVTNP